MGDVWIPIADAAARLRLSYNQVLRLVLIGRLEGKRRGLRWMVSRNAVNRFATHAPDNRNSVLDG